MIGNRIKELRTKKGVTQEAMANKLGLSPQAISKWEQNITMPDISMLVPVADYFRVSVDYLLREPQTNNPADLEKFVEIVSKNNRRTWTCTVKNVSDRELMKVVFKTHFYDKEGNSIDCRDDTVTDLEPGTVKPVLLFSSVSTDAVSVKIVVKSIRFAAEPQP